MDLVGEGAITVDAAAVSKHLGFAVFQPELDTLAEKGVKIAASGQRAFAMSEALRKELT